MSASSRLLELAESATGCGGGWETIDEVGIGDGRRASSPLPAGPIAGALESAFLPTKFSTTRSPAISTGTRRSRGNGAATIEAIRRIRPKLPRSMWCWG